MLLHKAHAAISDGPEKQGTSNKNARSASPAIARQKFKAQIQITEFNFLLPVEKTNQIIELEIIRLTKFKHGKFFILISLGRYSRWRAPSICETPTGKTAKHSTGQYVPNNGLPQTIRTGNGRASTGKEFRSFSKYL